MIMFRLAPGPEADKRDYNPALVIQRWQKRKRKR